MAILAEPLEALIAEAVLYRLDTPEMAAALAGASRPDDDAERATLARDQAQLEELAAAYGERQITFTEYLAARKPIEARIEPAQRRIARTTGTEAIARYVGALAPSGRPGRTCRSPVSARSSPPCSTGPPSSRGPPGRTRFDPDRVEPLWRV